MSDIMPILMVLMPNLMPIYRDRRVLFEFTDH